MYPANMVKSILQVNGFVAAKLITWSIFYPLNPIVHFWLHHTAHCALHRKDNCACGSVSAERVGEGEVGVVTHRVTCTWWLLLGLAVKAPWLGQDGPILALAWAGGMTNMRADYCMLIHEWEWLRSSLLVQNLKVDLGSVLESELGLKWRYGAWKAFIG